MKTLKLLLSTAIISIFFASCQSEEDITVGENPNTANSTTAQNFERVAMNDGSQDDFLDGNTCTQLLFPLTATVNGQQIVLVTASDLSLALQILSQFNDDNDVVSFNFPIRVRTSNYSEVTVNNQSEFSALQQECEEAEAQGRDAISCINFTYPITILTYNVSLEQTGSVVLQSEKQLYTFMTSLKSDELFSVNYPINATLSNTTSTQITSDAELQNAINDCVQFEDDKEAAAAIAADVEAKISKSKFKVESFITAGVDKASDYADWSIEFTNDLKVKAKNTVNVLLSEIEGTYNVSSETEVFLQIVFANNTAVSALGNEWIVESYTNTIINLKSKTNATVTLRFRKL